MSSLSKLQKIKQKMNISDRSTEKLCRILREDNVNVESNARKFLANIDKFLKPFDQDEIMEMEVNVTKRVIKTVRGRGGKLAKKPVEMFFPIMFGYFIGCNILGNNLNYDIKPLNISCLGTISLALSEKEGFS